MLSYPEMEQQLAGILTGQRCWYTNLSQFSALLNEQLEDINWVGFYLVSEPGKLKLGPFQGHVACVDIPFGKGVCGTAAETGQIQRIADVHAFPGHIACDSRSQSEIVIPMNTEHGLVGVLDIDSPSINRFSADDQAGLSSMVKQLVEGTDWPERFNEVA